MDNLIKTLSDEHCKILDVLNSIRSGQGIGARETRDKIIEAKDLFLHHLQKEDNELYPILRREAEKNPALKKSLAELDEELRNVSEACMSFFNRYQDGNRGDNFIADLADLAIRVKSRLTKEEEILYKEYGHCVG